MPKYLNAKIEGEREQGGTINWMSGRKCNYYIDPNNKIWFKEKSDSNSSYEQIIGTKIGNLAEHFKKDNHVIRVFKGRPEGNQSGSKNGFPHESVFNNIEKGVNYFIMPELCTTNNELNEQMIALFRTMLYTNANNNSTSTQLRGLLEHGANPNYIPPHGHKPIVSALMRDNLNITILRILLEAGVYINDLLNNGMRLIAFAIFHNQHFDIVKLLIDGGANVNSISNMGYVPLTDVILRYMPLSDTIKSNKSTVIKLLIDNGADVNLLDRLGCVPLYYAIMENSKFKNTLILKELGYTNVPLKKVLDTNIRNSENMINILIKAGADVNILTTGAHLNKHGKRQLAISTFLEKYFNKNRNKPKINNSKPNGTGWNGPSIAEQ
jgi:ankyrin repeat protein